MPPSDPPSVFDETWEAEPNGDVGISGPVHDQCIFEGLDPERAKLAAAAPDLYRALLAVQWSGWETFGGDGLESCCPSCGALGTGSGVLEKHKYECALDAALKKAKGS